LPSRNWDHPQWFEHNVQYRSTLQHRPFDVDVKNVQLYCHSKYSSTGITLINQERLQHPGGHRWCYLTTTYKCTASNFGQTKLSRESETRWSIYLGPTNWGVSRKFLQQQTKIAIKNHYSKTVLISNSSSKIQIQAATMAIPSMKPRDEDKFKPILFNLVTSSFLFLIYYIIHDTFQCWRLVFRYKH